MSAQHEPWAYRVSGDEATRKAGQNLREWAGDDRGRARRFIDRVLLRDDKDPKLSGLLGEEAVGKQLDRLDDGWTVLHGVRVGPKADIDHLVIGPPGVFCLNTKRIDHEADIVVSARQFRVNGYSRDYYPKAAKEASRVEVRLHAAIGQPVTVRPVLVVTGANRNRITVKEQPTDVAVVLRRELVAWLQRHPAVLDAAAVQLLARKARHPGTWDPSRTDAVLDVAPPVETELEAPARDVVLARWNRYGHDRLYVNDAATGQRLGWRDLKTGHVHVEDGIDARRVHDALTGEFKEPPAKA